MTRLSNEGFLCVDIHLPTDIDVLSQMSSAGANVYLYLKDPNPQPGELKSKVPPHLLHPKLLLFDNDDGPSDLWVGSHNWTARALTGVNIEASLRVSLTVGAALYADAAAFLERVRTRCVRFDPNAVDYYKWLQGAAIEEPIWVLELSGLRSLLDTHRKLTVFGQSDEDYRNLKSVDKSIVVSLLDPQSMREVLYEATVSDTGHLTGAGVDFDARVYAAHTGPGRPPLSGPMIPLPAVRRSAKSWATVTILEELQGVTCEVAPRERWIADLEDGAAVDMPTDFKNWFSDPTRPLINRPVSAEVFERKHPEAGTAMIARENVEYSPAPKRTHLALSQRQLLRKKVVRAKRANGEIFTLAKRRNREDGEGP